MVGCLLPDPRCLHGLRRDALPAPSNDTVTPETPPPSPEPTKPEPAPPSPAPREPYAIETWRALVPEPDPVSGPQTVTIPIGGPAGKSPYKDLELPKNPTKTQVRIYVGTILRVADQERELFSGSDPEIEAIKRVGPDHVDVLIEPFEMRLFFNGGMYLTEALKSLVTEDHKKLILDKLSEAPQLVEIVVLRGWTKDAAPTLFEKLAERDSYLNTDWVKAAASVATPSQYDDLKYQLRHGGNPYHVWTAIKDLPRMGSLESIVVAAWRATPKEETYEWESYAMAAAHYGHMEGLEFIVSEMGQYEPAWLAFKRLTGQGADLEFLWPEDEKRLRAWFNANKDRMTFDRKTGRYVLEKR